MFTVRFSSHSDLQEDSNREAGKGQIDVNLDSKHVSVNKL